MAAKRDYYEVLGIGRNATTDEIKRAFRSHARNLHPDNKESGDEAAFKELASAYEVLSDPHRRSQYDRYGHEGVGTIDFGGIDFSDFGDLGDIFASFFSGTPAHDRRSQAEHGSDLRYDLSLKFEEAVFGVTKKVTVRHLENCTVCSGSGATEGTSRVTCTTCSGTGQLRHSTATFLGQFTQVVACAACRGEGSRLEKPCTTCHGSGQVHKSKEIEINIPAGVEDHSRIRVSGQGDYGRRGGSPGDLYIVINVEPHAYFERAGTTIFLRHIIGFAAAALGGEVSVPTVDGPRNLKVPAGTQSGTTLSMHGLGVPHLNKSSRRGDQIVQLIVKTPTRLTAEEKKLFERLEELERGSGKESNKGNSSFNFKGMFALVLLWTLISTHAACATRLPEDLSHALKQTFKGCKVRIDGAVETRSGNLFLPVLPPVKPGESVHRATITFAHPNAQQPDIIVYSDGYCFLKLERLGTYRTIVLPTTLPDSVRHQIVTGQLPGDLIVPEAFVLPESLSGLSNGLAVRTVPDKVLSAQAASNTQKLSGSSDGSNRPAESSAPKVNAVLVTSVRSGKVIMLDPQTLMKIAEFSTEGTPTGMVYVGGRAYIADEGKNRVLILDCEKREFLGQIDLLPKSAPRGIAKLPNGRLLYLSESSAADVAIIETATHKILLRTKVAVGPGKIAVTPNGAMVLVLHGPSGLLSILSTSNQRLLIHLKVGTAPSNLVITSDSHIAYVSNRASNSIAVIDLMKKQVIGSLATGDGPTALALSSDNGTLYVANARENTLGIYNLKTHKKINVLKLPTEVDFPSNIALTPDGKHLLITSEGTAALANFDLESQTFDKEVSIGCPSHQILLIP